MDAFWIIVPLNYIKENVVEKGYWEGVAIASELIDI